MAIKVGCFALIDPFSVLEHQLDRIRDWGFKYADVTDSTDGGSMGVEYGFAAVATKKSRLGKPITNGRPNSSSSSSRNCGQRNRTALYASRLAGSTMLGPRSPAATCNSIGETSQ